MAIDFGGLATTDNYASAFVPKINEAVKGSVMMLDPVVVTYTGTPFTGSKRLNTTSSGVFETFNGTTWVATPMSYLSKTGGTLTGALAGTSASFSGNVNAANFFVGTGLATDLGSFGLSANGPSVVAWGNSSAGAGKIEFYTQSAKQLAIFALASAVNFTTVSGGTTGVRPNINASGSDTNVGLSFSTQGSGDFAFFGNGGTQFQLTSIASANRYVQIAGSNGGNPTVGTSAGMLNVTSPGRFTSAGSSGGDVASTYLLAAQDKLSWIDSSRSANNREVEFLWSSGVFTGRFVNDAYSAAFDWLQVIGGQAGGVSSIRFLNGTTQTNAMNLTSVGLNVTNVNSNGPTYQLQVTGLGQQGAADTVGGAKGGSLLLLDTGVAGAGQGGSLLFGAFGITTPGAGIKGYITDAANNSRCDMVFSTRKVSTDAALTEVMRITATGLIQDGAGLELGYKNIPRNTSTTAPGQCYATSSGVTFITGLPAGTAYSIYNDSAAAITLTQGSGVTLRLAGTTSAGNRTLAARGFANIWCNSTTEYVVAGAGVT